MSPCGFGKEKTLQNSGLAGGCAGGGMDFFPSIASSNTNPNIFSFFLFSLFQKTDWPRCMPQIFSKQS
jgi:hypothetical protein